jgi:predicted nucleic acid-binding protein
MNVVDSSGWLEYFAEGPHADFFAPAIEARKELIVPVITVYQVFKRVLQQKGEDDALYAIAHMLQGKVIDLDTTLALQAAKISVDLGLPMADSFILATARAHQAIVWTLDEHFKDMEGVQYLEKTVPHSGRSGE